MNELSQIIGRFHPVLVHLPIGMLLLAVLFEALSRTMRYRPLQRSLPFLLMLGSMAAVFSCLSGWMLSQNGDYEAILLDRHQWLGIAVAVVSLASYWLKIRGTTSLSLATSFLLLPAIALTTHWGITLTHGVGYLSTTPEKEETETRDAAVSSEIPDVQVAPPGQDAIADLQKTGVLVSPVGKEQPFLSLNFVNAPAITPAIRQALAPLRENVVWLKLSGTQLSDDDLAFIAGCRHLTKLHLDRTTVDDASLQRLLSLEHLVYLNLVGTKVTKQGGESLARLHRLKKIFLYQTGVTPSDSTALQTKLPFVQIDFGGYRVPVLPTDTTFLSEKKQPQR
ncbi:MAG: hypothetical protein OHK0019_36330 [Saprospiraceae bacterium]